MSFPRLISSQNYALVEVRVGPDTAWEYMTTIHRGATYAGQTWEGGEGQKLCARYTSYPGSEPPPINYCITSSNGIAVGQPSVSTFGNIDEQSVVETVQTDLISILSPTFSFVEPESIAANGRSGVWRLSANQANVMRLHGAKIPYTMHVCFGVVSINWQPNLGGETYTSVNPRADHGGFFSNVPLHSLVYGIGSRGVGGKTGFCIEAPPGQEVFVSVNDTDYSDNSGTIVVNISWH